MQNNQILKATLQPPSNYLKNTLVKKLCLFCFIRNKIISNNFYF